MLLRAAWASQVLPYDSEICNDILRRSVLLCVCQCVLEVKKRLFVVAQAFVHVSYVVIGLRHAHMRRPKAFFVDLQRLLKMKQRVFVVAFHCTGIYSSLGFVTVTVVLQTLFSEFGICCVANFWDMLCLQTFGMCCVADCQGVCIDRYS